MVHTCMRNDGFTLGNISTLFVEKMIGGVIFQGLAFSQTAIYGGTTLYTYESNVRVAYEHS